MYLPRVFKQNDYSAMIEFIKNHSLGSLVSYSSMGLMADHIPLMVVERNGQYLLQGHIAKTNGLWQDYDPDAEVLVMFHGPESYVSPNWYVSKKVDGKVVPTWNYVVVHVREIMQVHDDPSWLFTHLTRLSDFFESTNTKP